MMHKKDILSMIWKYIIITILIAAAYFPTFSGEFIYDDDDLVNNNQFIKESHSIAEYFRQEDGVIDERDLGEYHSGYYRPLINMTYRLDYKLWGMDANGFRITNLILHILCCFVILNFYSLLMDRHIAFWITIIFALHPVNTESVSFVVSRNNIIVTLFVVSSLLFYIIGWERKNYVTYIASLFLFAGAVLSKEFGLMVFPLIFLYQRILTKKRYGLSEEIISYIPFILIALFYFLLRKLVTESLLTPSNIENIWHRIYFAPYIIFYNIRLIFTPYKLHIFYLDYPADIFIWYSTASFLIFLLICFSLWKVIINRLLIFSITAFLICIFPALNIIPHSSISLIAMRWLYLPTCFLLIGVGILIQNAIIARKNLALSILIVVIAYFGIYTYILNRGLWHDNDTLIKQEVLGFDNHLFASDMGEIYFNDGEYQESEKYFKIAIEKIPYQAYSYIHLSALLTETERPKEAIILLNKAKALVMTHHEKGEWYNNMGTALFKLGDKEEGLKYFRKAVIYAPNEPLFWSNLGGAYGMMGDYQNSIEALKKGLIISSESVQLWTNLALTYINIKKYKDAISVLESIPGSEIRGNSEVLGLLRIAREGLKNNAFDLDI